MVITGYANMISSLPVSTSAKNIVVLGGRFQQPMGSMFSCVGSQGSPSSCSSCFNPGKFKGKYAALPISDRSSSPSTISFHTFKRNCFGSDSKQSNSLNSMKFKGSTKCKGILRRRLGISLACNNMNMRLLVPIHGKSSKIKCNVGPFSWSQGVLSTGLAFGSFVCYSSSGEAHAEAPQAKEENDSDVSCEERSHGKKLYTDFSVTGIPGDGRCLFRSVAHGACLRSGKPAPNENLQRELADDLRARVADEFIKRRQETEWFIEGDFDTYVSQIRRPHVWGGEPELLMTSHVLQMPITVYMYDDGAAGLLAIAEYGQEYGKENPIRVLYHGFGHYDALQIPGRKSGRSRL